MTFRTSSSAISLVVFLGLSSSLCAQTAKTPTLGEILQRLEANLNHYDTGVPSFFCDEHVLSKMEPGVRDQNTVTDSVFRLKRTPSSDHTSTLIESREIKSVNGKPPTKRDLNGPTVVSGVFEGGLAVVSHNQTSCMRYDLERINRKRSADPYIIRFATALTPENISDCLLQEKSKGRVFIDPPSMQITHLELTTPHHTIIPGNAYEAAVVGKRDLTIDYAPVPLGGQSFWMPSTITSRNVGGANTFDVTVWSFQATYRNYHRLEVTSRILPAGEVPAP